MIPSGRWMWLSVGLTLAVGLGVGVIADRLLLQPTIPSEQRQRERSPYWFYCGPGLTDVEKDPAYPFTERYRRVLVERLSEELSLAQDQQQRLEELLNQRRATARQFWDETRTYYCYLQARFRAEIQDLLEEEQKEIFADMLARLDARQAKRMHPSPPTKEQE